MNEESDTPDADASASAEGEAAADDVGSKAAREAAQLAEEFLESLRRGDAGLDSPDEELAHDVLDLDRGEGVPLEQVAEVAADAVGAPKKRPAKRGVPPELVAALEERARAAEAKVEELTAENEKHYQARLRLQADFENYRKRVTREREEAQAYAHEDLVKELLPTIDNLERALEHAEAENITGPVVEGVQITLNQALHVLSKFGVVPFDSAGEAFDPQLHDAMSQVETAEVDPGHVASQFVKGYHYRERLLRPAMVAVAMAPSGQQADSDAVEEAAADEAATDADAPTGVEAAAADEAPATEVVPPSEPDGSDESAEPAAAADDGPGDPGPEEEPQA